MPLARLYRSNRQAVIGGVCGGLAEYFDVDPVIIRLAWAVAVFMGGIGFPAYLIAWLIIPVRPEGEWAPSQADRSYELSDDEASVSPGLSGTGTLGVVLVVAGAFLLARNLVPALHIDRYWPLLLVAAGVYLICSGAFRPRQR